MKIEGLRNQYVKLSPRSITCKNEYWKTKGVVTGVVNYWESTPNERVNCRKKIMDAGLFEDGESEKVYIDIVSREIYYLFNLQPIDFYKKYIEGRPGFEDDKERYERRLKIAEEAAKIATVIPCYIYM